MTRWHDPKGNLRVGDIVLEKGNEHPRNECQLPIEAAVKRDGLVRRVRLRMGDCSLGNKGWRCNKVVVIECLDQKVVLLLERF